MVLPLPAEPLVKHIAVVPAVAEVHCRQVVEEEVVPGRQVAPAADIAVVVRNIPVALVAQFVAAELAVAAAVLLAVESTAVVDIVVALTDASAGTALVLPEVALVVIGIEETVVESAEHSFVLVLVLQM